MLTSGDMCRRRYDCKTASFWYWFPNSGFTCKKLPNFALEKGIWEGLTSFLEKELASTGVRLGIVLFVRIDIVLQITRFIIKTLPRTLFTCPWPLYFVVCVHVCESIRIGHIRNFDAASCFPNSFNLYHYNTMRWA